MTSMRSQTKMQYWKRITKAVSHIDFVLSLSGKSADCLTPVGGVDMNMRLWPKDQFWIALQSFGTVVHLPDELTAEKLF